MALSEDQKRAMFVCIEKMAIDLVGAAMIEAERGGGTDQEKVSRSVALIYGACDVVNYMTAATLAGVKAAPDSPLTRIAHRDVMLGHLERSRANVMATLFPDLKDVPANPRGFPHAAD